MCVAVCSWGFVSLLGVGWLVGKYLLVTRVARLRGTRNDVGTGSNGTDWHRAETRFPLRFSRGLQKLSRRGRKKQLVTLFITLMMTIIFPHATLTTIMHTAVFFLSFSRVRPFVFLSQSHDSLHFPTFLFYFVNDLFFFSFVFIFFTCTAHFARSPGAPRKAADEPTG